MNRNDFLRTLASAWERAYDQDVEVVLTPHGDVDYLRLHWEGGLTFDVRDR